MNKRKSANKGKIKVMRREKKYRYANNKLNQ
jgi:hypothetical protein